MRQPEHSKEPVISAPADAVLALSFGRDGTDGANRALARIASQYSSVCSLPVICQEEVCQYLDNSAPMVIPRSDETYLDTAKALSAAKKEFCDPRNWDRIVLVAHPALMWRAAGVAQRLKFEVRAAKVNGVPYDPLSSQWWTHSKTVFAIWNGSATLYYLMTGRMSVPSQRSLQPFELGQIRIGQPHYLKQDELSIK